MSSPMPRLDERAPVRRSRLASVALALGTLVVVLGALELGARGLGLRSGFFLLPSVESCLQRDPLLSLSFRPQCAGEMSQTVFRTNALGLRGPEVRDDDSPRILAIGDSCTWGWRVGQGESYPAVLQSLLGDRTQVLNAGVPGYTSTQGLLYLRERGLALRPSTVVLAYGFNDVTDVGDIDVQLERERRFHAVLLVDDFLLGRSTLYRWLRWQANAAATHLPPRVAPDRYRRNLTDMIRLARAHGAAVVVLGFWDAQDRANAAYVAALRDAVQETGAPFVAYEGPRLDVVHPTRDGYRTLAEAVRARLD